MNKFTILIFLKMALYCIRYKTMTLTGTLHIGSAHKGGNQVTVTYELKTWTIMPC